MPVLDYSKFNRVQKTAVFLIVVGQEAAANLVKTFADGELEAVCREMAKLPVISDEIRQSALDEFSSLVDVGFGSALGGTSYVRGTLELARGEHRAAYLLERVAPAAGGDGGGVSLPQFEGMDTRQVFSLLRGEQPQTVAFLLSQLDFAKAGEILRMLDPEQRPTDEVHPALHDRVLDPEQRAEVIERLGEMESTSPEVVRRIAQQFNKRATTEKPAAPPSMHHSGGAPFVANLLKTLDKEASRSLLAVLQDRNATLSDTIRKKLFSFDDMAALTNADIQKIMREVESADLATALKGPRGEIMLKKVAASMSKRAAEGLHEEIEMLAPVRPKDQEAAQDRILAVVRKLEEQGEITLDQGDLANAA